MQGILLLRATKYLIIMESRLVSKILSYYSEAETLAIALAFQAHVYLCNFHREQSWERWIKDHKHGLAMDEGEST